MAQWKGTWPAVAVACALIGFVSEARADDAQACVSANESAQTLRQNGKLRAARAQLLTCVARGCPGPVRDDCAERLNEVEKAIPTIVFTAKGPTGSDLSAVKVTMDGAPLAERLDGSALSVDSGEHVFEFTTEGSAALSNTLLISEGIKGRHEVIVFPARAHGTAMTAAPVAQETTASSDRSGRQAIGYAVGGAGLVGIGVGTYFALKASSTYDAALLQCPGGPTTCGPDGVNGGGDAHAQARVSTIAFIAGSAMLVAGIVVLLTAPSERVVKVQASVGPTGAAILGSW